MRLEVPPGATDEIGWCCLRLWGYILFDDKFPRLLLGLPKLGLTLNPATAGEEGVM